MDENINKTACDETSGIYGLKSGVVDCIVQINATGSIGNRNIPTTTQEEGDVIAYWTERCKLV